MKRDPEAIGDVSCVLVVTDDSCNGGWDVTNPPPSQQIEQAMGMFGDQNRHSLLEPKSMDRPISAQSLAYRGETGSDLSQVEGPALQVEENALIEAAVGG